MFLVLPSTAAAQQPQPWSNTSSEGVRVPFVEPTRDGGIQFRFRVDAARSDAELPVESRTGSNRDIRNGIAFGGSVLFGSAYEAFLTSVAWESRSTLGGGNGSTIQPDTVYKQWGDVALGFRWNQPADGLRYGAEGGLLLFGKNNQSADNPGRCCPFIEAGATSLFARGMAAYSLSDDLHLSGAAGLVYDRTWNIWAAAIEELQPPNRDDIYSEERRAFGIYGNGGPILRPIAGIAVNYGRGTFQPFGEASFELNGSELAMRLTPGVRVLPGRVANTRLPTFLIYADVNPLGSGAPRSAPAEPQLRFNVGIQHHFGADPRPFGPGAPGQGGGILASDRPANGGTDDPSVAKPGSGAVTADPKGRSLEEPPASRKSVTVQVVDENDEPVPGAQVEIQAMDRKVIGSQSTDRRGLAVFEREALGERPLLIQVRKERWASPYRPYALKASQSSKTVKVFSPAKRSIVTINFFDEDGSPLAKGKKVRVRFDSSELPEYSAVFGDRGTGGVRAALPHGQWTVRGMIEESETALVRKSVVLSHETAEEELRFQTGRPTMKAKPARQVEGLFQSEMAEVNPGKARNDLLSAITESLNANGSASVIVVVKSGSDELFQETLAFARQDALKAFLKTKDIPVDDRIEFDWKAGPADAVRIE